ncbi:MAG: hypothetical protein NE327_10610 [Lentisphaeraceae bacterium]|nr:hypothetical protein [Lentisphaeraceae bacterium]
MKHVNIGDQAHKAAKDFCGDRNLKLTGTLDKIILEGLRALRDKEALQRAI